MSELKKRAVFLDRDGVIVQAVVREGKPYPPHALAEAVIPADAKPALDALQAAGYILVSITNQPDVARGTQRKEVVEAINQYLMRQLPIAEILVCYHDNADHCDCRKPQPGLILQAAEKYNIDLSKSFMIGDRWKDIEAGQRAHCETIFIDYGYDEKQPPTPATKTVASLAEAADWILERNVERKMELKSISDLKVKIFADGAEKKGMLEMYAKPYIKGFTTNPTLMRKSGISDYKAFALDVLQAIPDRPISFEVFSDDLAEMKRQALLIAEWGQNVYVKVPVTNTFGIPTYGIVHELAEKGVRLNVTALMSLKQVCDVSAALGGNTPSIISVFAGRIADTGRDPLPIMSAALATMRDYPNQELIWASPREVLNIFQADAIGCHIITVTNDILKKLDFFGKDLDEFSLDTVKMFRQDALAAGYQL